MYRVDRRRLYEKAGTQGDIESSELDLSGSRERNSTFRRAHFGACSTNGRGAIVVRAGPRGSQVKRENGVLLPTVTDNLVSGFFGDFRWLSNFHLAPVKYGGIVYPSNEHAYQAAKTDDETIKLSFLGKTPTQARKLGQTLPLSADWDTLKLRVMYDVTFLKYDQNIDLREMLRLTGDAVLVEENYWGDKFWGCCCGTGENHLGRILMRVRENMIALYG